MEKTLRSMLLLLTCMLVPVVLAAQPIRWGSIPNGAFPKLSVTTKTADAILFNGQSRILDSSVVSLGIFGDSSSLTLVKSPTSKKGLTYLVDTSGPVGKVVDYFFAAPDSSSIGPTKKRLYWIKQDTLTHSRFLEIATEEEGMFPYSPSLSIASLGSRRGGGVEDSLLLLRMKTVLELDSFRQLPKSCEFSKILRKDKTCLSDAPLVLKPMIYLYPETSTAVNVRIGPLQSLVIDPSPL